MSRRSILLLLFPVKHDLLQLTSLSIQRNDRWNLNIFLHMTCWLIGVCARVCFNTRNLTFNTCSYKVWLTWYVITWKDFFFLFLKRRKSRGTECYSRLFSMRLREKEHACRTESCSWQDRACCNQCRLQPSLFFFFFPFPCSSLSSTLLLNSLPACLVGDSSAPHFWEYSPFVLQ